MEKMVPVDDVTLAYGENPPPMCDRLRENSLPGPRLHNQKHRDKVKTRVEAGAEAGAR